MTKPMESIYAIYKRTLVCLDPELRDIKKIVYDDSSNSSNNKAVPECDKIFEDRLRTNPISLKLSYWKDHFEWKSVSMYPEIKNRMLDFGCGTGHSDIFLARNRRIVHGVDASLTAVRIANYLKTNEAEDVKSLLSFEFADVTIDYPSMEPFDSIWSSHVFEHISDPGPVIKGLHHWVTPGAYFLVSVPLGYSFNDPGHVHHFMDETALRIHLEKHLEVVRAEISAGFSVIRALCRFA